MIANHPQDYSAGDNWQEKASQVLKTMMPPALGSLLDEFLAARLTKQETVVVQPEEAPDDRRLGF